MFLVLHIFSLICDQGKFFMF